MAIKKKTSTRTTRPAEKSASDESLAEERAQLEQERKIIEADKASLRAERDALERDVSRGNEDRVALQQRVTELENAATSGTTLAGPMRGEQITVERGDLIAYNTLLGTEMVTGGWVKCSDDDDPNYKTPLVGVSLDKFTYDSVVGAPMHSVRYQKYKRFFENGGAKTIGQREPIPDVTAVGV